MRALALGFALLALASCAVRPNPIGVAGKPSTACHAGPDGAAGQDDPAPAVDRGIGGTGVSDDGRSADRGIGGTGIIGVIDGFASLCLNGLELRIDESVPVLVDGAPATTRALRVGQVVAVDASGPNDALTARRIVIQHEVSGPIQSIDRDARTMVVAGQTVLLLPHHAWGRRRFSVGDWVAVSGLRQPDGALVATRLETATPGSLVIYGPLAGGPGQWRIGLLPLRLPRGANVSPGQWAGVRGIVSHGVLVVARLVPDSLEANAPEYFGHQFNHLVIQSYGHRHDHRMALTGGLDVPLAEGAELATAGSKVIVLDRDAAGSLSAREVSDGDSLLPEPPDSPDP